MADSRSTTSVILGSRCNLSCTVCDCLNGTPPTDDQGVPRVVHGGGDSLFLRGESALDPAFGATLAVARERWRNVYVRTNGWLFTTPEAAKSLKEQGVRGVVVPLFSHVSKVHDRIAGREGSLVAALRAMRLFAAEEVTVRVETPLLPAKLQDLGALVRLAHRAVESLESYRFFVPTHPQPAVVAPPPWSVARVALTAGLRACKELGIKVDLREADAIPLCVLGHDAEFEAYYRFDPKRPVRTRVQFSRPATCGTCAVKNHCLGPCEAYQQAHGERDLQPFSRKPTRMFDQRTTPRRVWTDEERKAASDQQVLRVLRPTIHCNQDCPFCSANETSADVLGDSKVMFRKIARVARQGVRRLSFGGGEPTLSKHLVDYIHVAAKLGIEDVEIITNGVLIDSKEKVAPLAKAGLRRAFVSLHAHDELLSRRMTSKVGDWEKTVRAIDHLVGAGVLTEVNHVINSVNYQYLPRFADLVIDRWKGEVGVSFAFVTPQFRALENAWLIPKMSDVVPYLRRAMRRLALARVRFVVGSRQGIPPCFLGEYEGWSDVVDLAGPALAEDRHQKTRSPVCDSCKYSRFCNGLWKFYVQRNGLDELRPVPGHLSEEDLVIIARTLRPHRGFEELAAPFKAEPRAEEDELPAPAIEAQRPRVSLPMLRENPEKPQASQVVGVAMVGSGPQAQRLTRALDSLRGMTLLGVASPHLLERDPGFFQGRKLFADLDSLLEATHPQGVILAATTTAHLALGQRVLARGLPVLIEKPLAQTREEARQLVEQDADGRVMVAHTMLFSPGMQAFRASLAHGQLQAVTRVNCRRSITADSPEALPSWNRTGLFQSLYHLVYLVGAAVGSNALEVERVEARGDVRPEWISAEMKSREGKRVSLVMDFTAKAAAVELIATLGASSDAHSLLWRREGAEEYITRRTSSGDRMLSVDRGSDTEGLLEAFRARILGESAVVVSAQDGLDVMTTALSVLEALARQLQRPGAPRHVATAALR